MKALLVFTSLVLVSSAFAKEALLKNPLYKGLPIFSNSPMRSHTDDSSLRSHMVCQMYGYARAAIQSPSSKKTVHKTKLVLQPTKVFEPASISMERMEWYGIYLKGDYALYDIGLISNGKPEYLNYKKPHPCAEVATCRDVNPETFFKPSILAHNLADPFVKTCHGWATQDTKQPYVFTEILCETDTNEESQVEVARKLQDFHHKTNNRFSVTSGQESQLKVHLANYNKTCNETYSRAAKIPPAPAKYGECHFVISMDGQNPYETDFNTFVMASGRLKKYSLRNKSACAQKILKKYQKAVIREEYPLRQNIFFPESQTFCVEKVSKITYTQTESGLKCEIKVGTKDFLQAETKLNLSIGSEGNNDHEVQEKCEELAACLVDEDLKCENAGFCPAPGIVKKAKK